MNVFSEYWLDFLIVFALFAKSLWFFYYFSLYAFEGHKSRKYEAKTTLIIPVFNEHEDKLKETILSIKKAKGVDEIIFVNDGSDNNTLHILNQNNHDDYKIIDIKQNGGKRNAHYEGIKASDKDTEIFVFIDSDTVLLEDSILNLKKYMYDNEVGGVTGCVLVKNRTNFLSKCLSAMFWTGSKITKQATSNLGFVQVSTGALSSYRAYYLRKIMPYYVKQSFLGVNCTLSDDRYLTHYIQTVYKKKIVYADDAIAYTYVPETFKAAYKMFLRWKRGALREAILSLQKFKEHPLLVFDIWANQIITFMRFIVKFAFIGTLVINPLYFFYYLLMIAIISTFFAIDMLFKNPKEIIYRIAYSFLDDFIFSWTYIHAWLTIREQGKWITR
ncbi:MAG: glycosyltransferase [Candidatus Woesearchaeota archaeon]|nr:glycosyltransferase [Candidatus Woesearchaeota archaeon]